MGAPSGTGHGVSAEGLVAERSLPAAWASRWRAHPDRVVLRGVGTLTASGLDAASADVAGRLHGAGVAKGERVIVSAPASVDLVIAYCACVRLGAVVVPVNPAYTSRELSVIAADSQPSAVIADSETMRAWAREELPDAVVVGTDVALAPSAPPPLDDLGPGDPALLPYTSGTTGTPKGALLSHANLLASAEAIRRAWRWTEEDRLILCLPMFHMHGLGVGLHGTLLAGASAILQARFDPESVLGAANDATMLFGVPTMYARLVDEPRVRQLGALRLCVSGSAPLAAQLHRRLRDVTGQTVLERYGMTETAMLVSNPYLGERRAGTVGFPLPGVDLRLADGGEVLVRGQNVFAGYWRRPDATAASFTKDGWFTTGDVGAIDGDGYLSIVGRTKELIITGGYNVYPREIEDVLRAHPAVSDAAVVGVPSKTWGEVVTAFVEATDAFDPEDVAAFAAEHLAPYKRPRDIHRIDELPRNALGKVQRDRLGVEPRD